ncbi:hypothetical protein D910_09365 [Dendroctonus ponderosae]
MEERREKAIRSMSRSRTPMRHSYNVPKKQHRRHREKLKDCCRKMVAFMCTQVGVGALIIGYTVIGAVGFMHIEKSARNSEVTEVSMLRNKTLKMIFAAVMKNNIFDRRQFHADVDQVLKNHQLEVTKVFKHGYDERSMEEVWSFPAALMFCLSIITMVGYGNMVPKTKEGKILTMVYALFGIPLYILYFMVVSSGFTEESMNAPLRKTRAAQEKRSSSQALPVFGCHHAERMGEMGLFGLDIFLRHLIGQSGLWRSGAWSGRKCLQPWKPNEAGLGLVAMCYNLMREEIKVKLKEMNEDFNQCLEDTKVRFLNCCQRCRRKKYQEY